MFRSPRLFAFLVLLALLAAIPTSLEAATFLVPSDAQLFEESDVVAVVKVVSFQPRFDDDGEIVTEIALEVEETIKGVLPPVVRIVEMGGIVGNQGRVVSGVPDYYPGERALVFLTRHRGAWRTHAMLLGKFSFVATADGPLLARGAAEGEIFGWDALGNRHTEKVRRAPEFLRYLRGRAAGLDAPQDYFVDVTPDPPPAERVPWQPGMPWGQPPEEGEESAPPGGSADSGIVATVHVPPSAYTMGTFRWKTFDDGGTVRYRITGTQPGYDSTAVADAALAAWTNDPGSNVRLSRESGVGGLFAKDGVNSIVYSSATDVPSGAIGYAQIYSLGQHTYKGETFWTVVEGDVAMKAGLTIPAAAFQEAVTHEVGHTIALRHSDQGTPSSSDAVMNSFVTGKWGATLAPWDREAVGHVYTATSGGTPPPPPTFTFTDDPLVAGTVIKAVHLQELRNAVNSLRAYAGLAPASWTDSASRGVVVKAIHWTELRDRLNEARAALGRSPVSFPSPVTRGAVIRAAHVQALRNGVRL